MLKKFIIMLLASVLLVNNCFVEEYNKPVYASDLALETTLGEMFLGLFSSTGFVYAPDVYSLGVPSSDVMFVPEAQLSNFCSDPTSIETLDIDAAWQYVQDKATVEDSNGNVLAKTVVKIENEYGLIPSGGGNKPPWKQALKEIAIRGAIGYMAVQAFFNDFSTAVGNVMQPSIEYSMPMELVDLVPDEFLQAFNSHPATGSSVTIVSLPNPKVSSLNKINVYSFSGSRAATYIETKVGTSSSGPRWYAGASMDSNGIVYRDRFVSDVSSSYVETNPTNGYYSTSNAFIRYNGGYAYAFGSNYAIFDSEAAMKSYLRDGGMDAYIVRPGSPDAMTPSGKMTNKDQIKPYSNMNQNNEMRFPKLQEYNQFLGNIYDDGLLQQNNIAQRTNEFLQNLIQTIQNPSQPGTEPSNPDVPSDPDMPDNNDYLASGLEDVFPFCIPFDMVAFFKLFDSVERKAPRFEVPIKFPHYGVNETVVIDLSPFEPAAVICRLLFLLLFIIGLMMATRYLIFV